MIRTVWTFLVAGAELLVLGTIAIVGAYLGLGRGYYDWAARTWCRSILWAAGVRVRARGLENLRRDRPQVIASNHQSMFDVFVLAATVPVRYHFVAKKELRRIPIFGRAAAAAGHVFLDRGDRAAAIESLREASRRMREANSSAIVFPEGTRSLTGELLPFKKGPFVLAIEAGVPVVPTAIWGTFDILPKRGTRIRPRPVTVWFGEPVDAAAYRYDDREALVAEVRARMCRMREALAAECGADPARAGRVDSPRTRH